jgi:transcriptional regulator with XRE-family HTH domain
MYYFSIMELEVIFGEVIKRLRKEKGISQDALALKTGLHLNSISLFERGLNQPTLKTVFVIAEAFEMKPEELIRRVSEDHNSQKI